MPKRVGLNRRCQVCGKPFYARPSDIKRGYGKYCSARCRIEGTRTGKYVKCAYCGKEIYKTRGSIKRSKSGLLFCSVQCSTAYSKKGQSVKCQTCGKTIWRAPWQARVGGAKFCSRECAAESQRKRVVVTCAYCGKEVYKRPSESKHSKSGLHFCSRRCSGTYFSQSDGSRKYMKRETRRRLKQRGKSCQICGWNEPEILEIHHIDGNRQNNADENLLMVCPNCHVRLSKGLIDHPSSHLDVDEKTGGNLKRGYHR